MSGKEIKLLSKFVRKQKLEEKKLRKKIKPKDLDSFFIENPFRYKVRKVMTRFLQGISATLLVIGLGLGGYYTYQDIVADLAFDKAHYEMRFDCWNCKKDRVYIIKKGTKATGTELTCDSCGIMGKIP